MADASYSVSSFLGGEWSKTIQGRFDEPQYKSALNVCFNSFPVEEGAWVRRPGTQFAGFSRRGAQGRIIGFDVISSAPYDLELTPGWLRVWKGQQLAFDQAGVTVGSISIAKPAVLTVASQTWATGDSIQFILAPGNINTLAMAYLSNRQFVLTRLTSTTYSLHDQLGNALDGSQFALGSTAATANHIFEVATPWPDVPTINLVRIAQSENLVLIFAPNIQTQSFRVGALGGFTLAPTTFVDGPYLDPPTDLSTVTAGAKTGNVQLQWSVTQGFTSANIGQNVRLFSQPAPWDPTVNYSSGDNVTWDQTWYQCIKPITAGAHTPDVAIYEWQIYPSGAKWAYATITSITDDRTVQADLHLIPKSAGPNIVNDFGEPLLYLHDSSNPIIVYQMGLFWGAQWPTNGTFHEGRFWYAGAVSNRIDSSVANVALQNSPTYYDGSVADDSGISAVFNFPEVYAILSMTPTPTGIICRAQCGEVLVQSSQLSDPITPTSIQAHEVTKYGSANVEPVRVGFSLLMVQRYAKKLLDLTANVFSGRVSAANVSLTGEHLTEPGLAEIRFQRELTPILWATCPNGMGNWIGMSYKREDSYATSGPLFSGWHRHQHGGNRYPVSITIGTSQNGQTDALAMITNQPNPGFSDFNIGHVEFLTKIFREGESTLCAWQVDNAIVPVSATISGQNAIFYGFWHGLGRRVSVYAGGLDCGDYIVQPDSSVIVPFGACNGLFTETYLASINGQGCYQTNIAFEVALPTELTNNTINAMGTVTTDSTGIIADWPNRKFYSRLTNGTQLFQCNMDTGAVIATATGPSATWDEPCCGADSKGNVYFTAGTTNCVPINKYEPVGLTNIGSFGSAGTFFLDPTTQFQNPGASGNMTSLKCDANYIVSTAANNVYVLNADSMSFAGCSQTLITSKNSEGCAGPQSLASATAYFTSLNITAQVDVKKLTILAGANGYNVASWPTPNPQISVASIGTVLPSAVDAGWTAFGTSWGLTYDATDGNIIFGASASGGTHQHYIVKVSTADASVIWAIPVGQNGRNNGESQSNTRVTYGTLAYYDTDGNVYIIDTIAGTLTSTIAIPGLTVGGDLAFDDASGDIFSTGSYSSGTAGAPTRINGSGNYTALWGRLDLANYAAVGQQNRNVNYNVPVVMGYTFNSDGQLVRPQTPESTGARNGPALGKTRRQHRYAAQVVQAIAGSISFGTSFASGRLFPAKFTASKRPDGTTPLTPLVPYTDIWSDNLADDYSYDGMLCWRISRPYPAIIASVQTFLMAQDR